MRGDCSFLQEKIVLRFRQYGLCAGVRQLGMAFVRRFYLESRDFVFVIPKFTGLSFHDPCISILSRERINKAQASGELNQAQAELLTGFLDADCIGVCAEIEGKLAGYAWVQLAGGYTFGGTGRIVIPQRHALLKYLFVVPAYRGMGIGQKLNAARLALIPPDFTPVVFIIPENRFAIRNWERFGFQRVLLVKRWQWGRNGKLRMQVTRLAELPAAGPLVQALEASGEI